MTRLTPGIPELTSDEWEQPKAYLAMLIISDDIRLGIFTDKPACNSNILFVDV